MANLLQFTYFVVAILFILGLKRMSSPRTARSGIIYAGWGMALAVFITLFSPQIHGLNNYLLILIAIALGGGFAWFSGRLVAVTNMPQMIAIYNGMGGGAAAAIAAAELLRPEQHFAFTVLLLAVIGAFIGTLSFSGSMIAYAKLQGLITRTVRYPKQQLINLVMAAATVIFAVMLIMIPSSHHLLILFLSIVFILGITVTLPIGGANMPIVISLFNAMTGLAVALEGFVLDNTAMIIAGTVVGASGSLLTQLMAKAMNQPLRNILFIAHVDSQPSDATAIQGSMKPIDANDAGATLAYAQNVIIVPGYGMAVAQAQHKICELSELLEKRGVKVKFAIHPVAGRMPGHMNVLLAEAGVPYDKIYDMEDINPEFKNCDAAIIIGANDVVNPAARHEKSSPIYGMPILNVDQAKNIFVIKRGQGKGFSGIENHLFYMDQTRMLYGDAQDVGNQLIHAVKAV